LPFDLTTLKLTLDQDPSSFPLIDALSRQSSITSLVVFTHGFDPAALLTRLAPLAPGLKSLGIYLTDVPGTADDLLKGCTRLKHLNTFNVPLDAVKHVAASLASWTVQSIEEDDVPTILDVLQKGSIATAKLKKLVLEDSSARASPRWAELIQMCKDKKIKLIHMD
jgi:hypothetical protein